MLSAISVQERTDNYAGSLETFLMQYNFYTARERATQRKLSEKRELYIHTVRCLKIISEFLIVGVACLKYD